MLNPFSADLSPEDEELLREINEGISADDETDDDAERADTNPLEGATPEEESDDGEESNG